jgi:peptidoglycan/xylan/chitin deacetylase (PgdA/CDA1 family)
MGIGGITQRFAQQGIKAGAALLPARPGTVVLIYHRVGGRSALDVDLATTEFERQIGWLAQHTNPTPLHRALATLGPPAERDPAHNGAEPPAPHEIVVTFDDGTADFAETALPILVAHKIPVTLYLATAFVEERRPFPDDGAPLSWAALRDACSTGLVEVGSHTHTHAVLDRLPPGRVADELDRSKELIEAQLGRPCLDFAYPKALPPSHAADAAVRDRFRSAALAGTRPNRVGKTDVFRLARSPIQCSDGTRYFERKVAGGMELEDSVRRFANRWRYRRLTS